jgi:DHA1 family tetracycline resistance protein-like MFS transporter
MLHRKPALVFIFFTLLLDVLGFGLLIPVAPRLVESLLHGGAGGTEAEAAPIVGGLQATFYAMTFLFAPLLGILSDRFGRRPVILISLLGSGLDYIAMALSPTIGFLFITRVINGLTGASFSAASAYVADVTPP